MQNKSESEKESDWGQNLCQVRSGCMKATIQVNVKVPCQLLYQNGSIDTGSSVPLISEKLFRQL